MKDSKPAATEQLTWFAGSEKVIQSPPASSGSQANLGTLLAGT